MRLLAGQVSKLFDISKDTLRHYEKIGLLKPEISKENRYRYYSYKHLDQLGLILWNKKLGISLLEIKEIIDDENIEKYRQLIEVQQETLMDKIEELKKLQNYLEETSKLLEHIENYNVEYDFDKLEIKEEDNIFYGLELKTIIEENVYIDYIKDIEMHNYVESEECYQQISITDDDNLTISEDTLIFIKENSNNKNIIQKHLIKLNKDIIRKNQKGSIINMKFWGTEDDLRKYILSIKSYFNNKGIELDDTIFIKYEFYLPNKNNNEKYFSEMILKINY